MEEIFKDNPVYLLMAGLGTILYLVKMLLLFVGSDADAGDIELDVNIDDAHHIDGGESFSLVSIQSILAFFMGAGWIGLAARREWMLDGTKSAIAAGLFGLLMAVFSAILTFKIKKLNSTVKFNIKNLIGMTGRVYMTIPERGQGSGQVEINVGGRQQIVPAHSTEERIESFAQIVVEDVDDSGILIVRKY